MRLYKIFTFDLRIHCVHETIISFLFCQRTCTARFNSLGVHRIWDKKSFRRIYSLRGRRVRLVVVEELMARWTIRTAWWQIPKILSNNFRKVLGLEPWKVEFDPRASRALLSSTLDLDCTSLVFWIRLDFFNASFRNRSEISWGCNLGGAGWIWRRWNPDRRLSRIEGGETYRAGPKLTNAKVAVPLVVDWHSGVLRLYMERHVVWRMQGDFLLVSTRELRW